MLVLLFLVRMTMAIQFQMVAALSPVIEQAFAVTLAEVGVLIGLYFAPGAVIAMPGGALGRSWGEKRVVLAGLGLMAAGGALMFASDLWSAQLAGRLASGVGGVLVNVLLTKMLADWFAGREISFAMAVFVNSWPIGIAVALMGLPVVAATGGLDLATGLVVVLIVMGLAALSMFYRAPDAAAPSPRSHAARITGAALGAVLAAGAIWGLYNAALAIVFSFGPQLLFSRGMDLTAAGSVTSRVLWCLEIIGPVAGLLADRSGRRLLFIAVGNLGFGFFVWLASVTGNSVPIVIAMGVFSGVAVGSMMSLPSIVLAPSVRAPGMGLFFSVYYLCIAAAPMVAGILSEQVGLAATFQLAAGLLLCTVALLPAYTGFAQRAASDMSHAARSTPGPV
jgi:MFS family permease